MPEQCVQPQQQTEKSSVYDSLPKKSGRFCIGPVVGPRGHWKLILESFKRVFIIVL